jgi:hypothetical protein
MQISKNQYSETKGIIQPLLAPWKKVNDGGKKPKQKSRTVQNQKLE